MTKVDQPVVASVSVVLADGRVTLVVVDIADALQRARIRRDDGTRRRSESGGALTEALRAFTRRSAAADVSLGVLPVGHGIETRLRVRTR